MSIPSREDTKIISKSLARSYRKNPDLFFFIIFCIFNFFVIFRSLALQS